MNEHASFPITVRLEGEETVYQSVDEIETDLEFFETNDLTTIANDVNGVRVRLRIWALELGLCQQMLEGEDEASFRIKSMTVEDQSGFAEVSSIDGTIRRAFTSHDVWPTSWNAGVDDEQFVIQSSAAMSASEFDRRWLDQRYGSMTLKAKLYGRRVERQ
jgi:hypothetical protein